jgi:hypothetical protein
MNIDANKWYSIQQIQKLKVMPFKSRQLIRKYIELGKLKGFIMGDVSGKRYMVMGKNLIIFLARFEAGDFHKVGKEVEKK